MPSSVPELNCEDKPSANAENKESPDSFTFSSYS